MTCEHTWGEAPEPRRGSYCTKCEMYASELFMAFGNMLTFHFPDHETAADFKAWLCDGGGEQQWGGQFDFHQGGHVYLTEPPERED